MCAQTVEIGCGLRPLPSAAFLSVGLSMFAGIAAAEDADSPCRIEVVERGSGWPVPLVELRTTHQVRLVSDNAGRIALDLPELMGRETWFEVIGHGYEVPRDGFGYRGVRLTPRPGQTLRVEVERKIIARRLGRLTGAGLLAESQRLGLETSWQESGIVGCDSVQTAVHRGRHYWLWGDTSLARYPLGIFHASSATTELQPLPTCEPPLRLSYDYFQDERGSPCGVAVMPGTGPTWVTGFVSLPDRAGEARLVGCYAKIKPPLEAYEWGQCVWDESTQRFAPLRVIWTKTDQSPKPPALPEGHPVCWSDEEGQRWLLFGNPLPTLRCPANFEAWQDPAAWEDLEPQAELQAADGAGAVKPHSGSIAWNAYRQCWVTVCMQWFGKPSAFGELWYAEAGQPTGPWGPAVKVLSHENYTFYNPRLHPEFTVGAPRILLFEGTYTQQFADDPPPTPRYDYNQILYRLDLDDPALQPAGAKAADLGLSPRRRPD